MTTNYVIDKGINSLANVSITKIQKYVTWVILLFIPLSTYITPIVGITLGDFFLFTSLLLIGVNIFIRDLNLNKIISVPLMIFSIFIIIHSLVFWMIKPNELSDGLLSVLRYSLYLFTVVFGARYFFDNEYAYKTYKKLAIIFALYCIIQFFTFRYFSVVLPSNLFGLPTIDYISRINSEYNISMYLSGMVTYRPRSVFLEPSYYGVYQIPILYLILNNKNENFLYKYGIALLITLSIFLAGTSTGILLLLFCWWRPIINELKKLSLKFIFMIMVFVPGLIYTFNSEYIQGILRRIISDDGSWGTSVMGRTLNFNIFFDGTLSICDLLFGQGKWIDFGYLPSYGAIVLSFGLIGLLIFFLLMIWTYIKSGERGRMMIVLMFITFIGTNTLFNISSVLFFFLIFSDYKNTKQKNSKSRPIC